MKVYTVRCSVEHPQSKKEIYARLIVDSEADRSYLKLPAEFAGRPFSRSWKPIVLKALQPKRPRADFLSFNTKVLVCSPRAVEATEESLLSSGELLPCKIDNDTGVYHIHNITSCADVLNAKRSVWERVTADWKRLDRPSFHPEKLRNRSLFKLQENHGTEIYYAEGTGAPASHQFKDLVEQHGLTGLEFQLVWSDEPERSKAPAKPKMAQQPRTSKPTKAPGVTERPLTASEKKDIKLSVTRGYKALKLERESSAVRVQKAIRTAIDKVVGGKQKATDEEITDLAVNLGCLWGQTVCDTLKWEWCFVKSGRNKFYAIAPQDRAYMVAPMAFVLQQLQRKPPEENTSLLLFNMLKAGSFPEAEPGSLLHVG